MAKKTAKKTAVNGPGILPLAEFPAVENFTRVDTVKITRDDGGPAFPLSRSQQAVEHRWGMSLRDYFAGQALCGLMMMPADAIHVRHVIDGVELGHCEAAYAMADAMLAARKK